MQLSYRLKTIASFVKGNRLADVGTDHGYVPIYLVENNMIQSAIAMDINKGPLLRAQSNIEEAHLTERIQTRLSDGVFELKPGEVDTILIAGMGGNLIARILSDGIKVIESVEELVLSPHSETSIVRRFLVNHNFTIVKEMMFLDEGKHYIVMKAIKGNMIINKDIEFIYGKYLLENKDEVLYRFLRKEKSKTEKILESLKRIDSNHAIVRVQELMKKMNDIEEALNYYN